MNRYRMFRRKKVFYSEDVKTGQQKSLRTRDHDEAVKLVHHMEEALRQPFLNSQIAGVYLAGDDPELPKRTWQAVFEQLEKQGGESTQRRSRWATKCKHFDSIRNKPLLETKPEDFLKVLETGGPSEAAPI